MPELVTPLTAQVKVAERLLAIDALRGIALVLMALDHSALFSNVGIQAEHIVGSTTQLEGWPHWVTGLLSNIAAPTFWLISGISVALYVNGQRRKGASEWAISRYLLTRAGAILLLDVCLVSFLWKVENRIYFYQFGVLSSIAVSLVLLTFLRFLPKRAILGLAVALLLGYQWLWAHVPISYNRPYAFWEALWFTYTLRTSPDVWFPVLGWFGLMGSGFVLGQFVTLPTLQHPRVWVAAGLSLLAAWMALRLAGGYGDMVPYKLTDSWPYFFIMSKWPPSLTFFLFNLGLALLAFALLLAYSEYLKRGPLNWLVVYGQASLFFYVAHLGVYKLLGAFTPSVVPGLVRSYFAWVIGLLILLPPTKFYRQFRQSHPHSILRYI